ncbi:MAG: DegT/DnrJ/EryC1/StrS aminotransferase family protein, partial [Flavobacteriaceae bacterium]|nr:DegT/DnrJ/EryC1/StrS aminotransferase family protein [Flavobacteriaceae bacterium]
MSFIDLSTQQKRIKDRIDASIQKVLLHGAYILGPEVDLLEQRLAEFSGVKHAITCANGTDALLLALMALQVKSGDVIFVPSFTFAATAEVVPCVGATPYFVDVNEDDFNIDPCSLEKSIFAAKEAGLRPRGLIAVDLFGLPADYDRLEQICEKEG